MLRIKNPKFGIIIPIFNTEKYLGECLDSITNQSYQNFVVYLVDDGSLDQSADVARSYVEKDSRFHFFSKKNGGVSSARNLAIEKIIENDEIELICFLDSDDIAKSNYLELFASAFEKNSIDYAIVGTCSFNKNGLIPRSKNRTHTPILLDKCSGFEFAFGTGKFQDQSSPAFSLFLGNFCCTKNLIRSIRFDEEKHRSEDQDFKYKALLNADQGIAICDIAHLYRIRKSSLSHSKFCLTDLKVFLSWLEPQLNAPTSAKFIAEELAFKNWWASLRVATKNKLLDQYWTEFSNALDYMQQNFQTGTLNSLSARKKQIFFRLGKRFLKTYFSIRKNKIKATLTDAYD